MTQNEAEQVLNTALEAGVVLLKSGGEMRRVEEVVVKIAGGYGVDIQKTTYSLTNCLMVSYDDDDSDLHISKVRQIPGACSVRMDILEEVNQLSRDIQCGRYPTVGDAKKKLNEIAGKKESNLFATTMFSGIVAVAFAFLLGGGAREIIPVFAGGALSVLLSRTVGKHVPRMFDMFLAGLVIGLVAFLSGFISQTVFSVTLNVEKIMAGAIMPLVPGYSFTSGFRDFGNTDYLSGLVRLVDAFVVLICMASGAVAVSVLMALFKVRIAFAAPVLTVDGLWFSTLMAFIGSMGFGYLMQIPVKHLIWSGLCGVVTWVVFAVTEEPLSYAGAMLLSTAVLMFVVRILSSALQCPTTVFLSGGIIITVPGALLFFAVFYAATMNMSLAGPMALKALITCGGIMLGIAIMNAIPQKFFGMFKPRSK